MLQSVQRRRTPVLTFAEDPGLAVSAQHATQSARVLEALFELIPCPVYHKDCAGRYVDCNEAFAERVFGLPKRAIIGRTLKELAAQLPRSLVEMCQRQDAQLMDHPGAQCFDGRLRVATGVERDVVVHKATYEDADGNVLGIIGLITDVTAVHCAEEELRRLRARVHDLEAHMQAAQ